MLNEDITLDPAKGASDVQELQHQELTRDRMEDGQIQQMKICCQDAKDTKADYSRKTGEPAVGFPTGDISHSIFSFSGGTGSDSIMD